MPTGSSSKRERQYEQIVENAKEHGVSDRRAKEVAARGVGGSRGPTKDELYEEARKRHIDGRSSMNKDELRRALGR
ncbi:hypothetical protein [Streptomyces sp. NPDC001089]